MTAKARTARVGTVSDDRLSDHEWKLKMATEGKAVYCPGRSVEMEAKIAAESKANECQSSLVVTLSPTDADRFTDAVQDVAVLVNQAENVFAFLALVLQGGDHEGHHGIADMAALASKALAGFGERQNEDLANLSSRLSEARKARKDQ